MLPQRLTDEQRRLLAEFEASAGDDTYRPDESLPGPDLPACLLADAALLAAGAGRRGRSGAAADAGAGFRPASRRSEDGDHVVLSGYADAAARARPRARRRWRTAGRTPGARSTGPCGRAGSGSGRPGVEPEPRCAVVHRPRPRLRHRRRTARPGRRWSCCSGSSRPRARPRLRLGRALDRGAAARLRAAAGVRHRSAGGAGDAPRTRPETASRSTVAGRDVLTDPLPAAPLWLANLELHLLQPLLERGPTCRRWCSSRACSTEQTVGRRAAGRGRRLGGGAGRRRDAAPLPVLRARGRARRLAAAVATADRHHLEHVLRLRVGDTCEVVVGRPRLHRRGSSPEGLRAAWRR